MVFLIYGEDTFRAKNALTATRERFRRTRDESGMNCVLFDAESVELGAVREALLTAPFLAEKKMVVIVGFLREKKEVQEELLLVVERLSDDIVAVFYEPVAESMIAQSPLFGFLQKQEFSVHCPALNDSQAQQFFSEQLGVFGVSAQRPVLQRCVRQCGLESWMLASEARKLAMFVKGSGRTEVVDADLSVLSVVDQVDEKKVFDFTDAYVSGSVQRSLQLFRELIAQGSHPLQLSAMLLKQLRTIVAVRDALDRGDDPKNLAKPLGVHPFVLMKATKIAERTTREALLSFFGRLLAFDGSLKSSATEAEDALCASMVS